MLLYDLYVLDPFGKRYKDSEYYSLKKEELAKLLNTFRGDNIELHLSSSNSPYTVFKSTKFNIIKFLEEKGHTDITKNNTESMTDELLVLLYDKEVPLSKDLLEKVYERVLTPKSKMPTTSNIPHKAYPNFFELVEINLHEVTLEELKSIPEINRAMSHIQNIFFGMDSVTVARNKLTVAKLIKSNSFLRNYLAEDDYDGSVVLVKGKRGHKICVIKDIPAVSKEVHIYEYTV